MLSLPNTSRHFFVIKVFKMPLLYVSAFVILFLSLSVSQSHLNDSSKEITLAMIKPDGVVDNHTGAVQKVIMESGFIIIRQITVQLVEETAARFYAEHSSRSFFSSLIKYITSGPVLAMVLEKENAISDWQYLIEPTDARLLILPAYELCVAWFQKRIVFMAQILNNLLRRKSLFSFEISFQMKL